MSCRNQDMYISSTSAYMRDKKQTPLWALSMVIVGIVMIFVGGWISYMYYTEIVRPNYDAYYQRYVGSSFPRIIGILILVTGLILFWGSSIFLVYTNYKKGPSSPQPTIYQYDTALPRISNTFDGDVLKENYLV